MTAEGLFLVQESCYREVCSSDSLDGLREAKLCGYGNDVF